MWPKARLFGMLTLGIAALRMPARAADVVLDESAYFRHYLRFGSQRYSPATLKADGEKILTEVGLDRLQRDTERYLQQKGQDPAKLDWMQHAFLPTYTNFTPVLAPPPPEDWTCDRFDDSAWVLKRRPFQGSKPAEITLKELGQYDESMDLGVLHAYYRARLVVTGAASADLTLTARYHGGLVVYLNGTEVARADLPPGPLPANPVATDYPAKAYDEAGLALRERQLPAVTIPAKLLHPGTNLLAIAVHASDVHPVAMLAPRQANWGGGNKPWPHAKLDHLEVRTSDAHVRSALRRPAGLQVWAADMHYRAATDDFLAPGEGVGAIRWVGARNGTFAAQLLVGSDQPLRDLNVSVGDLQQVGGPAVVSGRAVKVLHLLPFPEAEWSMAHLGDERGLNATFPDLAALRAFADGPPKGKTAIFDQLTPSAPRTIPADTCRPVWLSLTLPADAAAGEYRGVVKITVAGSAPIELPAHLTVADWALPAPRAFQTLVGCEENPYGVAREYGVKLWSEQHWTLLAQSFQQLARLGNSWVNVPVLVETEYGNRDDALIAWTRKKDQSWQFDYQRLDRYLDLCVQRCGPPRVINFVVMPGMKSQLQPPVPSRVRYLDEATGATALLALDTQNRAPAVLAAWEAFAKGLVAHLKTKALHQAMYWGHPLETEADPDLKKVLAAAAPDVFWVAGPHEMMFNGKYAKEEQFYKVVATIRYWGKWPSFRTDAGWHSKTIHLLNPRVGGTVFALHTTSYPFAYRVMPDHALAFGRTGFTRVGADEWAAVHYDGTTIAKWQTGIPVLFTLWPGANGAESSARFEALLEGIQETEARIFIEQALARGNLPPAVAASAKQVLAANLEATMYFQGNSAIYAYEQYTFGWQERSTRLYAAAAQVAKAAGQ